jgi:hypothetical protein
MALLPLPGTPGNPAQLGQQVALFADPLFTGLFGVQPGTVELESPGSAVQVIPPADVQWSPQVVIARLPSTVPDTVGSVIRVKPVVGLPFETPIEIAPIAPLPLDPLSALNELKDRLQLLVQAGEELVAAGAEPIELQPSDQPLLLTVAPTQSAGFAVRSLESQAGVVGAKRDLSGRDLAGGHPTPGHPSRAAVAAPRTAIASHSKLVPRPRAPGGAVPRATIAEIPIGSLDLIGLPAELAGPLAGASITVQAELEVTGIGDEELAPSPQPGAAGFEVLAVPTFLEQAGGLHTLGDPAARTVSVQVRVRLKADLPPPAAEVLSEQISLPPGGPLEVEVMPVEVPTMLALFRHGSYDPILEEAEREISKAGFVLVVVLENSNVSESVTGIADVLSPTLVDIENEFRGTARVLARIPALAPAMNRLLLFADAVKRQPQFALRKSPLKNLNRIQMIDQGGLRNDTEAEDQVSSLLLFGPPGTRAELYCRRDFKENDGRLNVSLTGDTIAPSPLTLPLTLAAFSFLPAQPAPDFGGLSTGDMVLGPADTGVVVDRPVAPTRKDNVFGDTIRSVKLSFTPPAP